MTDSTMDIDLNLIGRDKTADPDAVEVYRVLKRYGSAQERQTWKADRKEGWNAVGNNEMWTDADEKKLKNRGQVPMVVNKIAKGVQGASAIVTDSKPNVKFIPVGSSDLYVSELLQRGWDYVFAKNQGQDVIYDAVEEAKIGGVDFFKVWFDEGKGPYGRILFEAVKDVPIVYWDRDSTKRDMSDSHIIIAQRRTRKYIKEHYPELKDEDLVFTPDVDDPVISDGLTGVDNYTQPSDNPDGKDKEFDKDIWEIEAWMLVRKNKTVIVHTSTEDFEKFETIDVEFQAGQNKEEILKQFKAENPQAINPRIIKRSVEQREKRIVVGKKVIESKVNPFGVDADGDPVLGLIPLVHSRTQTSYPTSPTKRALPINRSKNHRRSQAIFLMAMEAASPIVEPHGCAWEGNPGSPNSRLVVAKNSAFQPFRLQGGGINFQQIAALEAEDDRDIDDQFDLPDVMRGKVPQGLENASGRMLLALQDTAGLMSKPFLRTLETSVVMMAKSVISLMLRHWPRKMWDRLLEDDEMLAPPKGMKENPMGTVDPGSDEELQLKMEFAQKWQDAIEKIRPEDPRKPPGIQLVDLDVRLTVGSSLPTNRMVKASVAMEFVKAGIYDPQAALEYVDDPQKDMIIPRMKKQQEALAQAANKK